MVAITPPQPAAAFKILGFEEPFGHRTFQEVWLRRYGGHTGEWLTGVMEATIQECQQNRIGIPPQFYDAKHDIEKVETARFHEKYQTVAL